MSSSRPRSRAYTVSTTNGQCCTIAGGSRSCSGVDTNSCIGGGILLTASFCCFSVWPMKLLGAGSSVRATTAKCPRAGSGSRLTISTDAASKVTSMTSPANTANSRCPVRVSHDCRPTASVSTDSCGTSAGKASSSADSGSRDRPRTMAVAASDTTRATTARASRNIGSPAAFRREPSGERCGRSARRTARGETGWLCGQATCANTSDTFTLRAFQLGSAAPTSPTNTPSDGPR